MKGLTNFFARGAAAVKSIEEKKKKEWEVLTENLRFYKNCFSHTTFDFDNKKSNYNKN